MESFDTIAALSTAPGAAGVAVIRVSGLLSSSILQRIFKGRNCPVTSPRTVCVGSIIDTGGVHIDTALVFFLPGPFTFTGEDVVELQCHGNPLLVQKILGLLQRTGARPAGPGEFTERAFLNGKLDLAQAEAICDLIHAGSNKALKLAEEQLSGRLSAAIDELGEPLRDILAEVEAHIDFPEEDIEPATFQSLSQRKSEIILKIDKLLSTYRYGKVMREGFRVLLCGPPNAGKSSVMNCLLGEQRVIVTPISGTTRDLVEENLWIDGIPFVLCDSAGITETDDEVERIGIELALDRVGWADLLLVVVDGSSQEFDWEKLRVLEKSTHKDIWLVLNKTDLPQCVVPPDWLSFERILQISALHGKGVEDLQDALRSKVEHGLNTAEEGQSTSLTNERHKVCLEKAKEHLENSVVLDLRTNPLELYSEELRLALKCLEEIVGKTYTEDVLGRIFSRFCIGK